MPLSKSSSRRRKKCQNRTTLKNRKGKYMKQKKSGGDCGCSKVLFSGGKQRRRPRDTKHKGGMGSSLFSTAPMSVVDNPVVGFGTVNGAQNAVDIISGKSADDIPYNSIPAGDRPLV